MDTKRVIEKLTEFLKLLENSLYYFKNDGGGDKLGWINTEKAITALVPAMEAIAEAVDQRLANLLMTPYPGAYAWTWTNARDATIQLIGKLEHQDEVAAMLGPQGPTLQAQGLHQWVWEAAARLWGDDHRREAVRAAGEMITLQLQAKLDRRDIGGTDLVTQAFNSADPKPDAPRLRFAGLQQGTKPFTDAHDGAMFFGKGCFMAIRNPATHTLDNLGEQEGLEFLASLSVLARWIETADVVPSQ